jgi:transglutaminase/protease-like cytokinesis protein 3
MGQTAVSFQVNETSVEKLARELTAGLPSELEKVKAIFHWITSNIDYQVRQVNSYPKYSRAFKDEKETHEVMEPNTLDERVALQVLKKRMAVCDGYSRLFKSLCNYAGITAELVTGYARASDHANDRFRSNHTWNAVKIDREWKLLDVTWASGFVSWRGDYFIRHLNEEYFLTEPAVFIRDHYPDDIRWTLLSQPPPLAEFQNSPYHHRSFAKYQVRRYSPSKGIIKAEPGETIRIELTSSNPRKDAFIYAEPFTDTLLYNSDHSKLLVPSNYFTDKITYEYKASDPRIEWLYILYYNDVILRYRLVISERK